MPRNEAAPTALYRLFDEAGRLLYIGITTNPEQRFSSHASTAPWWPLVADKKVEWLSNRQGAERAEVEAIKAEGPLYNRAGSDSPGNVTLDFSDFADMSIGQLRNRLADVVQATAVRGRITYVTSHGRRVAAIVPVPDAEAIEAKRQTDAVES